MQPSELLDLIKQAYGLKSDYQVMKRFGFTQSGVSSWRCNRAFPKDDVLIKFADALDMHLGVLLIYSMIWRQKNAEAKKALEGVITCLGYVQMPEDLSKV
ncbi:hypothetical protein FLM48_11115 [Shewanella sp. Scap07]|uniref:helix-turn-helix domain-containing protein n=1 Tax=Shewanella sp. Scap07 TaxID=2589987 RepID=UPI0015B99777|nr:hypothetical protein [Shewanella sp. Scap07]QLE85578.1 hypothetical protein FLM48_11115 [Shewanella sp. Scap07]